MSQILKKKKKKKPSLSHHHQLNSRDSFEVSPHTPFTKIRDLQCVLCRGWSNTVNPHILLCGGRRKKKSLWSSFTVHPSMRDSIWLCQPQCSWKLARLWVFVPICFSAHTIRRCANKTKVWLSASFRDRLDVSGKCKHLENPNALIIIQLVRDPK